MMIRVRLLSSQPQKLFRSLFKSEPEEALLRKFEAWSKKYRRTYSTKKDEPYWFKVFKANYESVNSKKMLPPELLERDVAYLNKFEAWSKKYRRTYSSKKDEGFWFMVFKANYGSQNDKTILPPKKLVMPIDGKHFAGILPKNFDKNSPLAKLHKRGQWDHI